MNPVLELLKAGRIVGLSPKEMMLTALEELQREQTLWCTTKGKVCTPKDCPFRNCKRQADKENK